MAYQEIDYPFLGGVDEKTQSQLVEPGAALTVLNLRQIKNGSYQKRFGHTALSNATLAGGSVPTCKRLLGYKDELCQSDGVHLYSRSATAAAWRTVGGYVPQLNISDQPVVSLQLAVQGYATTYVNGYHAIVYCLMTPDGVSFNIFCALYDAINGAIVSPPVSVAGDLVTGVIPRVTMVYAGNRAFAVYCIDGAVSPGIVFCAQIDTTSAASISAGWFLTSLATDTLTTPGAVNSFDAASLGGNRFAIAYALAGGSTDMIRVRVFNETAALTATTTVTCAVNPLALPPSTIAIGGNSADTVWVGFPFENSNPVMAIGLDPTTLAITASEQVVISMPAGRPASLAITWTGVGTGVLMARRNTAVGGMYLRNFTKNAGAVVPALTNPFISFNHTPDSKPFVAAGRTYMTARPNINNASVSGDTGSDPNQLLLIDVTASIADATAAGNGFLRVVGNITPRLSYGRNTNFPASQTWIPWCVSVVSSTKIVVPAAVLKNASSSSLDLITLDWGDPRVGAPSLLGDTMALSGSPPSFYDGVRVSEIGFFQRPTVTGVSLAGGGRIPIGVYNYVAVFEQIDSRGQWHQSNISNAFSVNVAAPSTATVTVSTLNATNRMDWGASVLQIVNPIRIVLYRTGAGGTLFFRVLQSEQVNNPTASTQVMAIDTSLDTELGDPLYTQPGIPNVSQVYVTPPPFSSMIAHGDRLIGATGKTVWFSFTNVYGIGYAFADAFQFAVESGGDITALASLDGSLVIFKRDKIAFVDGSGPPDNGAGGDFSPPQFIAADVGCIEPRSVVVTPMGVMFQSLKGIELLSRGRSLASYFGAHIEDTLAANPVITSAVLDEAKGLVIFTCLPTESSSTGVSLVWDYVNHVWTTTKFGAGTKSAIMWGQNPGTVPVRTHLSTSGNIFQESTSVYTDTGSYVSSTVVTPWVKMAGLQGYGRTTGIALLMSHPTPCDITVSVELDYRAGTVVQTRTFLASEIAVLRIPQVYMTMKTQKCEAFRLTITDTTPTGAAVGTGQGAVFVGLRIEYMAKKSINRAPSLGR